VGSAAFIPKKSADASLASAMAFPFRSGFGVLAEKGIATQARRFVRREAQFGGVPSPLGGMIVCW